MEYFELSLASDPKVIGVSNGIMQVEICDKFFLGNISKRGDKYFTQAINPFNRQLDCIKPLKKIKYTDFLSFGPYLSWHPFLVNVKTLDTFKKYNILTLYTYRVNIEPVDNTLNEYCLIGIQNIGLNFIDFSRTTFYDMMVGGSDKPSFKFENAEQFIEYEDAVEFDVCYFTDDFDKSLDMFMMPIGDVYISKRLRDVIIAAKLTGINYRRLEKSIAHG